jgi:hypothetical protein
MNNWYAALFEMQRPPQRLNPPDHTRLQFHNQILATRGTAGGGLL